MGTFLDQIHMVVVSHIKEHCLCPGIEIFFNILQTLHMTAGDNRNINLPRHLFYEQNGTFMILIRLRQIMDQKFIRPVVAVITAKRQDIIAEILLALIQYNRLAFPASKAGNQFFADHLSFLPSNRRIASSSSRRFS